MISFLNAIVDGQTLKIANCSGDVQNISNLNMISDGIYWINGYNEVTNKPYPEHFILISVSNVGGGVIVQTALPVMSSGRKTRMYSANAWSEWFSN